MTASQYFFSVAYPDDLIVVQIQMCYARQLSGHRNIEFRVRKCPILAYKTDDVLGRCKLAKDAARQQRRGLACGKHLDGPEFKPAFGQETRVMFIDIFRYLAAGG